MIICVDIGGNKTLVGAFERTKRPAPRLIQTVKLKTIKDFREQLEQIKQAISLVNPSHQIEQIVVGSRGEIDQHGRVTDRKVLGWHRKPLASQLAKNHRTRVSVFNDAGLATLAESLLGAGKRYDRVFYCTISSGIGTGFVINNELVLNNKLVLSHSGGGDIVVGVTELDKYSLQNTLEKLVSGTAINLRYGKGADQLTARQWQTVARQMALGINNFVVLVNPDVVLIGGGIGRFFKYFEKELLSTLSKYTTYQHTLPPIKQAELTEDGVLWGAAMIAMKAEA